MATGFTPGVLVAGVPGLNMGSRIAMTSGDEPGVAHPFIKKAGAFLMGNPIVYLCKLPGICLLCPSAGNNFNNPLGAMLVPSISNVLYTHAVRGAEAGPPPAGGDPHARDLGRAEVEALLDELASVGRKEGPPVTARMLSPGVGEVAIQVFSADVPARVLGAIRDLEAQGMRELVLDLRDNPGGEMNAFIELAGDFLEPGCEVVTVIDDEGDETVRLSWQEKPYRLPLTILVNRGTASAAELFAGCLAAHGRAVLVGGEMYGKRVGQAVVVEPGGEARAATCVRYRLPGEASDG
jgi:carboxyl-terminal processing protease